MKILKIFILLLFSYGAQAQYQKPSNPYGIIGNRYSLDSTLFIPTGCGTPSLRGVNLHKVALYGDSCNSKLYFYDPSDSTWNEAGGVSRSTLDSLLSGYYTIGQVDSIITATKSLFNGGLTGQTLVKNSNTDLDFSWQDESGIVSNYIDTTTQVNDSTIRFHFAQGDYVDYIIRTSSTVDTSHLSDRINANAANIATNTTNIATNTTNIAANTTAIAGKENSLGNPSTNGYVLSSTATGTRSWIPQSGGGGSVNSVTGLNTDNTDPVNPVVKISVDGTSITGLGTPASPLVSVGSGSATDTAFKVITVLNLKTTIPNNKGLLVRDTTLGTTGQNSPPIMWQGRNNGTTTLFAAYVDGNSSGGAFKILRSADSGTTWTTLMTIDKTGALTMPNTATFSSYVSAAQFAGSLMSFIASQGYGTLGANRNPNPNAQLEMVSTTRGLMAPVMTTDLRQKITGGVKRVAILTGGSGYASSGSANVLGGHGSGAQLSLIVTGGVVTSIAINTVGKNYADGDILSWDGNGGTGFTAIVTAVTGDTSKTLIVADSSTNQIMIWNGQAYQGEEINTSASTYSLLHGQDIVFTGTTATYTLPAPTTSIIGRQNRITIMNLGSGTITVNSNSGSTIMPVGSSTATGTITIAAGASAELYPTGTYFKVLYNN